MEGFPPETAARPRRETPSTDQAGYQQPQQSASTAGAALEAGGNLADLKTLIAATNTKLDTLNTVIGLKADVAWDGSAGSASLIAIMKAIWIKLP